MLIYLLFLLTVIIVLAFLEEYMGREKWYIYYALCFVLIMLSGFRPVGFDPDSEVYETTFQNAGTAYEENLVEYSFNAISAFLRPLSQHVQIVFLFYALLAIPLKFLAIQKSLPWLFLPLVVYFCGFYLLHDTIQMRASIASGLFLLSIKPLSEGRRWYVFLLIMVALIFHYSAMLLLIVLLFGNKPLSKRWKIALAALVPIGMVLFIFKINMIAAVPIPYIQEKIEDYDKLKETGIFDDIALFNPLVWIRVLALWYALYFYDTIKEHCSYLPLLLKIMGVSVFSFFALSSIPIISERVNELFGIIEILLIPYIFYTIKPQYAARILICILAIAMFSYRFFRLETFNTIDF